MARTESNDNNRELLTSTISRGRGGHEEEGGKCGGGVVFHDVDVDLNLTEARSFFVFL